MIIDRIENAGKIIDDKDVVNIMKNLDRYIRLEKGNYPVSEKIMIRRVKSKTKLETEAKIESHRKHIDIQIPLNIAELYYIYHNEDIKEKTEYDEINDVIFYNQSDKREEYIVNVGEFILLNVNEIHQPQIELKSIQPIEKIVIKVEI